MPTVIFYTLLLPDNAVFAVQHAGHTKVDSGRGVVIYSDNKYLHGALAMTMAPNSHLIVSNNDAINPDLKHPSALTEFTPFGTFVKQITVDSNPGGAFGLNVEGLSIGKNTRFAAVDDNQNLLLIWTLKVK